MHQIPNEIPTKSVNFRFIALPPAPLTHPAVTAARTALLLSALSGSGVVALAASRSTVAVSLLSCQPDFYTSLEFLANPFRQEIGSTGYSYYLAAAVMNHLILYGIPLLHVSVAILYARIRKVTVWEGLVWARFPSWSLLPVPKFHRINHHCCVRHNHLC
jgi:hypothetical protein